MVRLRDDQDAFGHLMLDHYRGREAHEIVERDDGFIDLSSGSEAYFREFRRWGRHEKAAMRYVRGRVLDIGCGAGRVALHLQGRGHDVVAIDLSPLAVKVSRLRGVRDARVLPVTEVGTDLGSFDTLLMFGNNFGLMGSFSRSRWLLRRFHGITNPGARLLVESLDVYRTKARHHLEYHALNRRRGRMAGQVRLRVRNRKYRTPWFDYLMVSRAEMRQILEGTGWSVERFLASGGPTYIAVIERRD